ncbi:hypothetical protein EUX98_g1750 [Antrodiella citrinella]|uniref:Altered inheritance of mitochondria protein 9, mitochondrial n=1 Tax=Antrodiella citrinella TaxID=2447956 RepID=A0A4S4N0L2_9APHY|nr:hypothetical protein EUX98_g1750 [Antrodiella citrinella]
MLSSLKQHFNRRLLSTDASSPYFTYTSGRWLCNENAQMELRRVVFNVAALQRAAVAAVGANSVTSMTKVGENINRVFLLTFDNGKEAIARLPTPIAGPPGLVTASEVATMDFLRRLRVPVPRILAWNSTSETSDVGAEYIIMEKAEGREATENDVDRSLVIGLAKALKPLADLQFKYHGSIYYKKDVPAGEQSYGDFLLNPPSGVDFSPFVIGPIAQRDWWRDDRAKQKGGHGPWSSAYKYAFAVAHREQLWLDTSAKPYVYDHYLCGLPGQGKIDDHIEILNSYKDLLPYIMPDEPSMASGRLWHPDLHQGNIFLRDTNTVEVASLIDWQGACVGPAFLQLSVPEIIYSNDAPTCMKSSPPLLLDGLNDEDRVDAERRSKAAALHKEFERLAYPELLSLPLRRTCYRLHEMAGYTWQTGALMFRYSLLSLHDRWDELELEPGSCPISFTPSDRDFLDKAFVSYVKCNQLAVDMDKEFGLGECGHFVYKGDPVKDAEEFRRIKEILEERRKEHMQYAPKHEHGQRVRALLWPYRDTLDDHPRTHLLL